MNHLVTMFLAGPAVFASKEIDLNDNRLTLVNLHLLGEDKRLPTLLISSLLKMLPDRLVDVVSDLFSVKSNIDIGAPDVF